MQSMIVIELSFGKWHTAFSYDVDNSLINSIIQYHRVFYLLICTSPNVFPIT